MCVFFLKWIVEIQGPFQCPEVNTVASLMPLGGKRCNTKETMFLGS